MSSLEATRGAGSQHREKTAKGGAQMKITVKKVEKVEATTQGTGPAA
jgi:hypothetical protein